MASPAAGELTAGQNTVPARPVPVTAVIEPGVTPALATELTWMLNPDQPSVMLGAVVLTSTVGAVVVPPTAPSAIVPPMPSAWTGRTEPESNTPATASTMPPITARLTKMMLRRIRHPPLRNLASIRLFGSRRYQRPSISTRDEIVDVTDCQASGTHRDVVTELRSGSSIGREC